MGANGKVSGWLLTGSGKMGGPCCVGLHHAGEDRLAGGDLLAVCWPLNAYYQVISLMGGRWELLGMLKEGLGGDISVYYTPVQTLIGTQIRSYMHTLTHIHNTCSHTLTFVRNLSLCTHTHTHTHTLKENLGGGG